MSATKTYTVSFVINVDAESPEKACARAWELLSGEDALLPVGDVVEFEEPDEDPIEVDLQEIHDSQSQPPEAATGGPSGA